ncbi:MAG TPA: cell division protein FtsZ [Candidatus Saccharimonadia bacterium]|nr:cell division protein FtsZ [Candidatus Saccharimonadia bacterium]
MAEIMPDVDTSARIKVIGVGGGGNSAVNRMIESKLQGVEFVVINTDAQALLHAKAPSKIHIGRETTRGLGAGADPEVGRRAAEESEKEIYEAVKGADMIFITLGEGGGTGTGAAPLIASAAREAGALVVAIVTKPFTFEGERRRRSADAGIVELKENVDTLITIPNDRLLQMIDRKTSLVDAFGIVDEVLQQGVLGISSLITIHGLINLDFADVKAIMSNAGSALMGIGRASGDNRAVEAARQAIDSPLLETSIEGARGVLFNITGGRNMTMHEIDEAAKTVTDAVDPDANIIFGAVLDDQLDDDLQITVVATGFDVAKRTVHDLPGRRDIFVKTARPEPEREPEPVEPEPEPEPVLPYAPEVVPAPRQPFINERPQVAPEPEVVPIEVPRVETAPPRRFPSLASIEPADDEPAPHHRYGQVAEPPRHHAEAAHAPASEPAYEDKIEEPTPASAVQHRTVEPDSGMPLVEDDLDVPAFIRRKVE